jgi:hypothetical protein
MCTLTCLGPVTVSWTTESHVKRPPHGLKAGHGGHVSNAEDKVELEFHGK